jgi:L-fuculose-phosphate aldolase
MESIRIETAMNQPYLDHSPKDPSVVREIIRYGRYLVRRGFITNTLGNVAVRAADPLCPDTGVVYTKSLGVSLEEMTSRDVIVTEIATGRVLAGEGKPSNGHRMSRAILTHRGDINAVIHTHPDLVIAYFSQCADRPFQFVSIDTAVVLGAPAKILPPDLNLESDPREVKTWLADTNCIVMPTHGLTTVGRTLSEAYHRHTAFVSEVNRVLMSTLIQQASGTSVSYVSETDTIRHYEMCDQLIYGIVRREN